MYGIFVSSGVLSGTGQFYPPKLPYLPARLARLAAVEAATVRFVIDLYCTLGKHSK
jgi:hypothetical protein